MDVSEKIWISILTGLGSVPARAIFYCTAAGLAFLFVRFLMQRYFASRRVTAISEREGQIRQEFIRSMRTIVLFGVVHAGLVYAALSGWTQLYRDFDRFGWGWFLLSIPVMILIHDTYFYWTHRLMHHPLLFKRMHRTHHLSVCTTPWAAYSFSSSEAFVQAGIAPLIAFTLPVHPLAFGIFMLWQMTFNVAGHCGYEIFPHRFMKSRWAIVMNSVTHHGLHHEKVNANYGLYFNIWDRMMGTNHIHYLERFDQLTRPDQESPVEVKS